MHQVSAISVANCVSLAAHKMETLVGSNLRMALKILPMSEPTPLKVVKQVLKSVKSWVLPLENMRSAMLLMEPVRVNRLLNRFF